MEPTYYRRFWHAVSGSFLIGYRQAALRQPSSPITVVYTPKSLFLHAASRGQTFVHCRLFLIAASRRSGGRVSVPLWLIILPDQLPVIGLVSSYLTNYLIGYRPIPWRAVKLFRPAKRDTIKYYPRFLGAILYLGAGSCILLSRPPLSTHLAANRNARLAYLRHTASIHPEPGSNS